MLDNQVRVSDRIVNWDGSPVIMFDEWDFFDVDKLTKWLANPTCWRLSDTQIQKVAPIQVENLYQYLKTNFYTHDLDPMWFLKDRHNNYDFKRVQSFFPYLASYEYEDQLIVCAIYMAICGTTTDFRDDLVTTWREHLVEALLLLIHNVPPDKVLTIIELDIDRELAYSLYSSV